MCVWTSGTCCPSPWLCSGYSQVRREKFNIPPQCIHNEGGIATMVRNKRERGGREQQLLINLSAFALQSSQSNRIFTLHPLLQTHTFTHNVIIYFFTLLTVDVARWMYRKSLKPTFMERSQTLLNFKIPSKIFLANIYWKLKENIENSTHASESKGMLRSRLNTALTNC